ncbi:MAG: ferritin family protein [Acidobacteriota bacterium]
MDIFDFALQMERDGEEYYRDLAQRCNEAGLRSILNMLANDEAKHYGIIQEMKRGRGSGMAETEVLVNAKNIFARMKEEGATSYLKISHGELYEKAKEIERVSQEFYTEKAEKVLEEHQKEIFLQLAEEEKQHLVLLENIIEFISRPRQWIENAEFHHLDEY